MEYTSREGKPFPTLEHLVPHHLNALRVGDTLDGELFTKALTFQEICSAVKRLQDRTVLIEHWIYDIVRKGTFEARNAYLKKLKLSHPLVLVPTLPIASELQMLNMHQQLVRAGYEGTIVRNAAGPYKADFRSKDLQKYKDFHDEEFKIIGGKEGVGKDKGAVTFLCETEEGKEFDCRPKGSYEQRREWWTGLESLIGKLLTVKYQARSDANIPIFPIGLSIRDYE
jgi:DNA ligase-1